MVSCSSDREDLDKYGVITAHLAYYSLGEEIKAKAFDRHLTTISYWQISRPLILSKHDVVVLENDAIWISAKDSRPMLGCIHSTLGCQTVGSFCVCGNSWSEVAVTQDKLWCISHRLRRGITNCLRKRSDFAQSAHASKLTAICRVAKTASVFLSRSVSA